MSKSVITHPAHKPAVLAFLTGAFLPVPVELIADDKAEEITLKDQTVKGDVDVAKFLIKAQKAEGKFLPTKAEDWIAYAAQQLADPDPSVLMNKCDDLTNHLQTRSFFVGYDFTLADFAIWSAVTQHPAWEGIRKTKFIALTRWLAHCNSFQPFKDATVLIAKKASKVQHGVYHDLPNAVEGKVVTRFPPEPSGFLHIGHCKAAMLNNKYADKYHGKLLLRFDDTNPNKEKDEYVENIKRDLKTLGIVPDTVSHSSDHFDECLKYAELLIKKGLAYADNSTAEAIHDQRSALKPSPCRDQTVEDNLKYWDLMKKGTDEGKSYCLRAKIDPAHKNGTMRDPAIYRVVLDPPHIRTGTKYKVYPLYDMVCPIVDSIEGVTHAMRSNEYHERDEQYYWLQKAMGLRDVIICDFARLNFTFQLLSKRKLQWFVDNGKVEGWNDPRFPTIQGFMRRGLTKEAMEEFILAEGLSKNTVNMDITKLWAINKRIIDPIIPRYTAVTKKDAVKVTVTDGPATPEALSWPKHRKTPSLGNKVIQRYRNLLINQEDGQALKENAEVTMMDWGNMIVTKIVKTGNIVTNVEMKLHLEGDVKKTELKLTWLPDVPDLLDIKLFDYDYLITKPSLEKTDKFEDFINLNNVFTVDAYGDPNLKLVQKGERFQFERRGYFICDQPWFNGSMSLIEIPDGSKLTPVAAAWKAKEDAAKAAAKKAPAKK